MALTEKNLQEARITVIEQWGNEVMVVIDRQVKKPMITSEFLNHCVSCGGNWGAMFLSGINALWPEVYEVIPDDMGEDGFESFITICMAMRLLGVDTSR